LVKIVHDYNSQATALGKTFDSYCLRCEQEEKKLANLQTKRMKEEALVRHLNNNSEYIKIKKTVEEKVRATLSEGKPLIYLALFCIIESIKENPDKYSPLFYENVPTMTSHYIPNYFQEQYQTSYFDTKAMFAEEAEKLYNMIAKRFVR